ncbi:MAG: hypothetical protein QMC81_01355 [Thermoanaerobacterales bacterium]|nr:hypothetical protein [Thermoanaerobacterales bacterium]
MGDIWTFTILYLGLIAGTLAVLAAVIWYLAGRYRRANFEDLLAGALGGEEGTEGRDWEERLARLEAKVDALWARSDAEREAETAAHARPAADGPAADQAEPLRRYRNLVLVHREASPGPPVSAAADDGPSPPPLNLRERVYHGFKQGKTITDLARESGRGKGEIELIINLRRATGTDGRESD